MRETEKPQGENPAIPMQPNDLLRVEYQSEVLGGGVFWQGPVSEISKIRNIPARQTAALVARDGKSRVAGMWRVSKASTAATDSAAR